MSYSINNPETCRSHKKIKILNNLRHILSFSLNYLLKELSDQINTTNMVASEFVTIDSMKIRKRNENGNKIYR